MLKTQMRKVDHLFKLCPLNCLFFRQISSTAEIIPKNPTVPLFILVFIMISGRLVRARVGKRSPKTLISFTAKCLLSSSISANFYSSSVGVIFYNKFFKSLSSLKLPLSSMNNEMVEHIKPMRRMVWEILRMVLQQGKPRIMEMMVILSKMQKTPVNIFESNSKTFRNVTFCLRAEEISIIWGMQERVLRRRKSLREWKIFWYMTKQKSKFWDLFRSSNQAKKMARYWDALRKLSLCRSMRATHQFIFIITILTSTQNIQILTFLIRQLEPSTSLYRQLTMASILRKAAKYRKVSSILTEGEAHLKDPFIQPPQILHPPQPRASLSPDDITDFPQYKTVPLPESIPYMEGKYRPPSVPFVTGWFPYNTYLQAGKVYNWCSCGISLTNPNCDGSCNANVTRCRPVNFNVSESGYYKLCNCKNSANAPFCNGTHRDLIKFYHKSHRGFYEIWGEFAFYAGFVYMYWNWYT